MSWREGIEEELFAAFPLNSGILDSEGGIFRTFIPSKSILAPSGGKLISHQMELFLHLVGIYSHQKKKIAN